MAPSERDDPQLGSTVQSARAAEFMDVLGLSEEELCRILDIDALSLLSGQLEHRSELPILLDLLAEPRERVGAAALRRWVRAAGPVGRPIEALLSRDFASFEEAIVALSERGFVLKAKG
jgi:hypothetical protein